MSDPNNDDDSNKNGNMPITRTEFLIGNEIIENIDLDQPFEIPDLSPGSTPHHASSSLQQNNHEEEFPETSSRDGGEQSKNNISQMELNRNPGEKKLSKREFTLSEKIAGMSLMSCVGIAGLEKFYKGDSKSNLVSKWLGPEKIKKSAELIVNNFGDKTDLKRPNNKNMTVPLTPKKLIEKLDHPVHVSDNIVFSYVNEIRRPRFLGQDRRRNDDSKKLMEMFVDSVKDVNKIDSNNIHKSIFDGFEIFDKNDTVVCLTKNLSDGQSRYENLIFCVMEGFMKEDIHAVIVSTHTNNCIFRPIYFAITCSNIEETILKLCDLVFKNGTPESCRFVWADHMFQDDKNFDTFKSKFPEAYVLQNWLRSKDLKDKKVDNNFYSHFNEKMHEMKLAEKVLKDNNLLPNSVNPNDRKIIQIKCKLCMDDYFVRFLIEAKNALEQIMRRDFVEKNKDTPFPHEEKVEIVKNDLLTSINRKNFENKPVKTDKNWARDSDITINKTQELIETIMEAYSNIPFDFERNTDKTSSVLKYLDFKFNELHYYFTIDLTHLRESKQFDDFITDKYYGHLLLFTLTEAAKIAKPQEGNVPNSSLNRFLGIILEMLPQFNFNDEDLDQSDKPHSSSKIQHKRRR